MRPVPTYLFAVLLFVGGGVALAASGSPSDLRGTSYPSNLDLLTAAVDRCVEQLTRTWTLPVGARILVQSAQPDPLGWLVEAELARHLVREGYIVILDGGPGTPPAAEGPSFLAGYRVIGLELAYVRFWQEGMMGKHYIDRLATSRLHCVLTEERTGRVVSVGEATGKAEGTVPADLLPRLETSSIAPVRSPAAESGIRRIVEPLIISGVVGGLIYLFYSTKATP